MREIGRHWPGRIFLIVLLLALIGMFIAPKFFFKPVVVFGWMPLPYFVGVVFCLVWLVAYLVYFFRFWPYRH